MQECGAGLVQLRNLNGSWHFAAPPTLRSGPLQAKDLSEHMTALGISRVLDHQWVDNGPGWAVLQVESADVVRSIRPNFLHSRPLMVGVIGKSFDGWEIRAFAPKVGVAEDPVTGSLNASVAQWFARTGKAKGSYMVRQGGNVGRNGLVHINIDDATDTVWVGGATRTIVEGTIHV